MFMEYTHHEHCDTNLSLGACNSRSSTDAQENAPCYLCRRYPDVSIFPQLEDIPSGTESMTSTTLEDSELPRTVRALIDGDAIIAAVVRESWIKSRDITRDFWLPEQRNLRRIFFTTHCLLTTTRRAQVCSHIIILYGYNLWEVKFTNPDRPRISSF